MELNEYLGQWLKVINNNELNKILLFLEKEKRSGKIFYPSMENIFRTFYLTPYNDLKICMIGQDPYPQKDIATGILFGNKRDTKRLSPSLNIVKEASINYEIPHTNIIFDHTLESWATQGILMLNGALTVEANKIGSHTLLWRDFMKYLLVNLSEINSGIIYILFGENAKTFKPYINDKSNYILEEKHPSYYARIKERMPSTVFKEANQILKDNHNITIEWYKEV